MPFSNFESSIDPTILKRGQGYFSQGLVQELEEIDKNYWSALVEGTEIYKVKVKIKGDKIIESFCNCPYDLGDVCKHQVAVYYAIREKLSGEKQLKKEANKIKGRGKTVVETIDEILEKLSHKTLKEISRDYALENREFRSILLTQAVLDDPNPDKGIYCKIIKESMRAAMGRDGFIDYWGGGQAMRGANELIDKAEKLINQKQIKQTLLIYQAIIEEVVPGLQYADDSNGELGDVINAAFEQLERCAELIKDKELKGDLFKYCLNEVWDKRYNDWDDWQWAFFRIAAKLVSDDSEEQRLFNAIEKFLKAKQKKDEFFDNYDQQNAAEIKLEIVNRRHTKEEAEEFIKNNLHYTSIRRLALEKAFENKQWSLAKKLSQGGVELDKRRKWPGLVIEWLDWLLKISEAEKNKEDIRKYAKTLFIEKEDFVYYNKLKRTYSPSDWEKEVQNLLKDLGSAGLGSDIYTFAEIFIREKQWGKLLNLVKKEISIDALNSYHKYLANYFPDDLIVMYEQVCRDTLQKFTGRSWYQDVCRMLRQMKKLGAGEKVERLIGEFKEIYRNRRALLEELDKI